MDQFRAGSNGTDNNAFFKLVHFHKVWVNLEQAARFFLIRFDRVNFDKSYHIIYVMDQLRAVSKVYSDIFNRVDFENVWISLEQAARLVAVELATIVLLHCTGPFSFSLH